MKNEQREIILYQLDDLNKRIRLWYFGIPSTFMGIFLFWFLPEAGFFFGPIFILSGVWFILDSRKAILVDFKDRTIGFRKWFNWKYFNQNNVDEWGLSYIITWHVSSLATSISKNEENYFQCVTKNGKNYYYNFTGFKNFSQKGFIEECQIIFQSPLKRFPRVELGLLETIIFQFNNRV